MPSSRDGDEFIPKIIDRGGDGEPDVLPAGEGARGTCCHSHTDAGFVFAGFVFSETTCAGKCWRPLALRAEPLPLVRRVPWDGGSSRPQRQHARQPWRLAFPF